MGSLIRNAGLGSYVITQCREYVHFKPRNRLQLNGSGGYVLIAALGFGSVTYINSRQEIP